MSGGIRLGSIFGIPLNVHYTWFLIFFLISYNLSTSFATVPPYNAWSDTARWSVAISTALLFFGSVLAHELSHSLLARWRGIPVHDITLFIFGGVSHISREANRPGLEAAIAVVGPLTSLALAGIFYGLTLVLPNAGFAQYALAAAEWLTLINLMLAVFNMLPGFPMDGGRVFRAVVWAVTQSYGTATRIASGLGRIVGIAFIVGGAWYVFHSGDWGGLWLVLIGWFIENGASSSYRHYRLQEAMKGAKVRDIMTPNCPTVPAHVTVDLLIDGYMLQSGQRCFMVMRDNAVVGMVTLSNVRALSREQWRNKTVSEVMTPRDRMLTAKPDDEAFDVLSGMVERDVNQVPVIDASGGIIGIVSREHLLMLVQRRANMVLE